MILVSIVASFSPLTANISLPVLSDVAKDTGATPQMVSLSVTSFMYERIPTGTNKVQSW